MGAPLTDKRPSGWFQDLELKSDLWNTFQGECCGLLTWKNLAVMSGGLDEL